MSMYSLPSTSQRREPLARLKNCGYSSGSMPVDWWPIMPRGITLRARSFSSSFFTFDQFTGLYPSLLRLAQNSSLIMALNCSSTSLACSSGERSESGSTAVGATGSATTRRATTAPPWASTSSSPSASWLSVWAMRGGRSSRSICFMPNPSSRLPLLQEVANLAEQHFGGARRGGRGRVLGFLAADYVHQLDQEEHHDRDHEELDQGVEEG